MTIARSILKYAELALNSTMHDTSVYHKLELQDLYNRLIYCGNDSNKLEQAEHNFNAALCLAETIYRDSLIFFRKIYLSADLAERSEI